MMSRYFPVVRIAKFGHGILEQRGDLRPRFTGGRFVQNGSCRMRLLFDGVGGRISPRRNFAAVSRATAIEASRKVNAFHAAQ